MKKIVVSLLLFCCMLLGVSAQNKIKQYEYWLDMNLAGKQTVSITPTANLTLDALSVVGLSPGMHVLNLRFLDTNNRYSAIVSQRVDAFSGTPRVNSCEYWFDDAYASKTALSLTPSATIQLSNMDLLSLANGFHRFNIRFSDATTKWSVIQTTRIYKSAGSTVLVNSLNLYRYWFDGNVAGAVVRTVTNANSYTFLNESIDLTGLPKGGNHILHLQVQDALGLWSSVQSMHVFNSGSGGATLNQILGYRYWMDSDFANNVYVPYSSVFNELNDNINLSSFIGNSRRLYLQFKDARGLWSSVLADTLNVIYSGLSTIDQTEIQISPNPNHGEFTIHAQSPMENVVLFILNSLGEPVYQEFSDQLSSTTIRLQNAVPGIYFLRITEKKTGKVLISRKMVVV